ncbi:MAG: glycosyltransferase family 4 protein [Deltaproteobacteria bacterium]|nr:glycosyltransferase family 4 protein [Deltaproteobacteria bacterium]
MKVLLTNFHPAPTGGGHSTYVLSLFKNLSSCHSEGMSPMKPQLFIAAPKTSYIYNQAQKIAPDRVFDVEFPTKFKEIVGIFKAVWSLKNLHTQYQFDIIHTNGSSDHHIALYLKWIGFFTLRNLRHRQNFHILRTKHDTKPFKNPFHKIEAMFTTRYIVVSEWLKNLFTNLTTPVDVVHNGIDVNYFKPREKNNHLAQQLGIQPDDFVLVSCAGNSAWKGWHFLTQAIADMPEEFRSSIKIIFTGKPVTGERFKTYVEDLGLSKQVLYSGFVGDIRPYIALGHIGFVLSHRIEAISFACRQMMAMGKPVIVSDYAGLPENLDNDLNGWIVKTADIVALREKIIDIMKNRHHLAQISAEASKKAHMEFNDTVFLQKTLHSYQLCMGV